MVEPKGYKEMLEEAKEYYYKRSNKAASYEQLYRYLYRKGYNLKKIEDEEIPYNEDVANTFTVITQIDLYEEDFISDENPVYEDNLVSVVDKIRTPFRMDHIMQDSYEKQKIKEKEDKEKAIEAREHQGFQISRKGYRWAIAGIIAGVVIGIGQIGISVYDIWVKDHEHETRMIQLDSMQVEQNKKIIELLEKNKQKDSITNTPQ